MGFLVRAGGVHGGSGREFGVPCRPSEFKGGAVIIAELGGCARAHLLVHRPPPCARSCSRQDRHLHRASGAAWGAVEGGCSAVSKKLQMHRDRAHARGA